MRVVFSLESDADLEDIGDKIAQHDPLRAITYVEEIRDACLGLADFPRRFPVVSRMGDDYRRFVFGRYSVFYLINDDHVRIVRIIQGARLISVDRFL